MTSDASRESILIPLDHTATSCDQDVEVQDAHATRPASGAWCIKPPESGPVFSDKNKSWLKVRRRSLRRGRRRCR